MICLNDECDLNDRNECASPSSVKIGAGGICLTWMKMRGVIRKVQFANDSPGSGASEEQRR